MSDGSNSKEAYDYPSGSSSRSEEGDQVDPPCLRKERVEEAACSKREDPTDFDLSQIHDWHREHILATTEEIEAKVVMLVPNPVPTNDTASSNRPSKGDAGTTKEQKAGEDKAREDLRQK
ncbi:hypothetical protein QYF36_000562 [Acer negundo]|nr:hypothetical protein QYF36_000562 [Acer negundo]